MHISADFGYGNDTIRCWAFIDDEGVTHNFPEYVILRYTYDVPNETYIASNELLGLEISAVAKERLLDKLLKELASIHQLKQLDPRYHKIFKVEEQRKFATPVGLGINLISLSKRGDIFCAVARNPLAPRQRVCIDLEGTLCPEVVGARLIGVVLETNELEAKVQVQ